MEQNNRNTNPKNLKSNERIISVHPTIMSKAPSNPAEIENIRQALSQTKILEQLKIAVNKFHAEEKKSDQQKLVNEIKIDNAKTNSSTQSVKETLRTTILHKNKKIETKPIITNKNLINNSTEQIKYSNPENVTEVINSINYSINMKSGLEPNQDNISVNAIDKMNSSTSKTNNISLINTLPAQRPIILNPKAHMSSNLVCKSKTLSNLKHKPNNIQHHLVNDTLKSKQVTDNFEILNSAVNTRENTYSNKFNQYVRTTLPLTTRIGQKFVRNPMLNNKSQIQNQNQKIIKTNQKILNTNKISQLKAKRDPKLTKNNNRKKIKTNYSVNSQLSLNEVVIDQPDEVKIQIDPLNSLYQYKVSVPSGKEKRKEIMPGMTIQKALINIEGKLTDNYRHDILGRRGPKRIKTTLSKPFLKATDESLIFKSPPSKSKDDKSIENSLFLLEEIEQYNNTIEFVDDIEDERDKNLYDVADIRQDKTDANYYEIATCANNNSSNLFSEGIDSERSPKLIQDLDSHEIYKQKSIAFSPKLVENINENIINENNGLPDLTDCISPIYKSHFFQNEETSSDAVDFLSNIKVDDEGSDTSDTCSSIDESEILRPEDFVQNISKTISTYNSEQNNYKITSDSNTENKDLRNTKSTPIVIENKILSEDEKINLNLCLKNSINIENNEIISLPKSSLNYKKSTDNFPNTENNINKDTEDLIQQQLNKSINDSINIFACMKNETQASCDKNNLSVLISENKLEETSDTFTRDINTIDLSDKNKISSFNDIKISDEICIEDKNADTTPNDNFLINNIDKISVPDNSFNIPNLNKPISEAEIKNEKGNITSSVKANTELIQKNKPRIIPISSKRPSLRGSKINLVPRTKSLNTINKENKLLIEPNAKENPAISPHIEIMNSTTGEKNFKEETNKGIEILNQKDNDYEILQVKNNNNNKNEDSNMVTYNNNVHKTKLDINSAQNFDIPMEIDPINDATNSYNLENMSTVDQSIDNCTSEFSINYINTYIVNTLNKLTNDDEPDFYGFELKNIKKDKLLCLSQIKTFENISKKIEKNYQKCITKQNKKDNIKLKNTNNEETISKSKEDTSQCSIKNYNSSYIINDNSNVSKNINTLDDDKNKSSIFVNEKAKKRLLSDSDSFGEEDSIPLKKRLIRNIFSNSSLSDSEHSRKENKIIILDKRAYYSSRKDSETSTTSDQNQSITDLNNTSIGLNENSVENSKNKFTINESNNEIVLDNKEKYINEVRNEITDIEPINENIPLHLDTIEQNHSETEIKPILEEHVAHKTDEQINIDLTSTPLTEKTSKVLSKEKIPEEESIKLNKNISKVNNNTATQECSNTSVNQCTSVEQKNPEIKKRGRKPTKKLDSVKSSPIPQKNEKAISDAFEKYYNLLMPKFKERKINKVDRKLIPNLLVINNRSEIDDFQLKETVTPKPNENEIICGLCKEAVLKNKNNWIDHLHTHYGVGWIEGRPSIDVTQYKHVLSTMLHYMKITNCQSFKCRMCGIEFKSALGILSHIISCGLSDEDKRSETHVICEHCKNYFHYLGLKSHMKTCLQSQTIFASDDDEVDNTNQVLSNTGRLKRKSTVKAESKFKEMEKDNMTIDVSQCIKTIYVLRGAIYRSWKKKINSGKSIKCCGETCCEMFNDIDKLKEHVNSCDKISRTTYRCILCNYKNTNIENVEKHINNEHEKALKNINSIDSGSEVEFSKKDLSESSDESSSGVDENQINENDPEESVDSDDEDNYSKKERIKNLIIKSPSKHRNLVVKPKNLFSILRKSFTSVAQNTYKWTKFFQEHNFASDPLFQCHLPQYTCFKEAKRTDFKSMSNISMKFCFSNVDTNSYFGSSKANDLQELECFQTITRKDELILFVGGPITKIEWIPLPDSVSSKTLYLAISYKQKYNQFTKIINQKPHKTLIIIYKLNILQNDFKLNSDFKFNSSSFEFTFEYGIFCDNGPIHDMKFLPSGGYDSTINRLGVLAVANVDKNVNIYSLPIQTPQNSCDENFINIIQLIPIMKLCLNHGTEDDDIIKNDAYFGQCCKIAWSKSNGHNMLATGYANGFVALWNIDLECNLNCFKSNCGDKEMLCFTPLSYFRISDKYITALEFHYDQKEPRWLVAASHSRTFRIFDIEDPSTPIILVNDISKSFSTSICWPIIWENLIFGASSDLGLTGPLIFSPMQLLYSRRRFARFASGATSTDYNPWNNICVIGGENGDFSFELRSEYNLDCTLKRYLNCKIFTYTDLITLDGSQHSTLKASNDQQTKKNNTENQNEKNNIGSMKTIIESYKFTDKEYRNKFGLVFGPTNLLMKDNKILYSEKRMPPIHLMQYVRINSVACNINLNSSNFYAVGYENGFVRIFYKKIPYI